MRSAALRDARGTSAAFPRGGRRIEQPRRGTKRRRACRDRPLAPAAESAELGRRVGSAEHREARVGVRQAAGAAQHGLGVVPGGGERASYRLSSTSRGVRERGGVPDRRGRGGSGRAGGPWPDDERRGQVGHGDHVSLGRDPVLRIGCSHARGYRTGGLAPLADQAGRTVVRRRRALIGCRVRRPTVALIRVPVAPVRRAVDVRRLHGRRGERDQRLAGRRGAWWSSSAWTSQPSASGSVGRAKSWSSSPRPRRSWRGTCEPVVHGALVPTGGISWYAVRKPRVGCRCPFLSCPVTSTTTSATPTGPSTSVGPRCGCRSPRWP